MVCYHQVITWTNVESDLCCYMASLVTNGLKPYMIFIPWRHPLTSSKAHAESTRGRMRPCPYRLNSVFIISRTYSCWPCLKSKVRRWKPERVLFSSNSRMGLTLSTCHHWKYSNLYYKTLSDIDGLVQERRNSIANALELRLSCTNPSKWWVSARKM